MPPRIGEKKKRNSLKCVEIVNQKKDPKTKNQKPKNLYRFPKKMVFWAPLEFSADLGEYECGRQSEWGGKEVEVFNDSRKCTGTISDPPIPPPEVDAQLRGLSWQVSQSFPVTPYPEHGSPLRAQSQLMSLSGTSWVTLVWWRNIEIELNQICQPCKKIKTSIWINSLCQYSRLPSGEN